MYYKTISIAHHRSDRARAKHLIAYADKVFPELTPDDRRVCAALVCSFRHNPHLLEQAQLAIDDYVEWCRLAATYAKQLPKDVQAAIKLLWQKISCVLE